MDHPIAQLPKRAKKNIFKYFSAVDYVNVAQTSKTYKSLFHREYKLTHKLLRKLLSHAALGEWIDAERIWKVFPELLTQRGTIYHPNRIYGEDKNPIDIPAEKHPGRYKYANCTAWQIALMNEEFEEAEKMALYMSEEEKQKQFAEIFPSGKITHDAAKLKQAKKLLHAVMDALVKDDSPIKKGSSKRLALNITRSQFQMGRVNAVTQRALNELYAFVKPKPEYSQDLLLDIHVYIAALKMFKKTFKPKPKPETQLEDKCLFWAILVEEYLASLLGTRYLRPHTQGHVHPLQRTGCVLEDKSAYFPFRQSKITFLPGVHFFVNRWGRQSEFWRRMTSLSRVTDSKFFENLADANHKLAKKFEDKYAHKDKQKSHLLCQRY